MEKRVQETIVEAFLEAHVKWHTRKHQMHYLHWCSCNFCVEKWVGTRYIGYTPFPLVRFQEEIARLRQVPCYSLDTLDIARDIVYHERLRKRKIVRERLLECKKEIL